MEKTNEKIYLVMWESNVNGKLFLNATPCRTLEAAEKKMEENIEEILGCGHFMHADKEVCTIVKDDNSYFIADETDDYWENTYIRVKELIG